MEQLALAGPVPSQQLEDGHSFQAYTKKITYKSLHILKKVYGKDNIP